MRSIVARLIGIASVSAVALSLGCGAANRAPSARSSEAAPDVSASASADNSIYAQAGHWVTQGADSIQLADLSGRVQVVAMVYTNCHSTCPLIIADMKRIEASLSNSQRDSVGFVLVSLDPMRDTPERMAEWANSIGLDARHWTLLSGDDNSVRETAAMLGVRYQTQQYGELAHSNGLTILDRRGNIAHQQMSLGESATSIASVQSLLY